MFYFRENLEIKTELKTDPIPAPTDVQPLKTPIATSELIDIE